MNYKTILFDVDDTLMDFGASEKSALHHAFLAYKLPTGLADYQPDYRKISKGLWRDLEQGLLSVTELGVERFRRLFLQHELDINPKTFNEVYLNYLGKEVHLMDGVLELFDQLNDYKLGVVTNGFTTVQNSRLSRSPLYNSFDHIITSEDAGYQKPHVGFFDYTFSKLGINEKKNVLIVGDSLTSDIQGGINYGVDTCWFNPHKKDNNTEIKPTYEICELAELIEIVEKEKV
ncbi:YjjG family noncanonical pyrimidine nucleotidase [Virgibacillus halodenitrificans]|uniref:YjjG family noncanonical pyrimidine nucleotidase n=1 Tax=Virgibacillus halodenitrificans TaxID=1482 RepID=UPI001FB3A330|nr:YjjG family noncanonical pyrimidine nucleotidase [Virgibacillus halodenitrificans]MCJ0929798.1 YjjG family noncanonical pyrimidine nucleotidase [Virgibacillus halodenitrificans]